MAKFVGDTAVGGDTEQITGLVGHKAGSWTCAVGTNLKIVDCGQAGRAARAAYCEARTDYDCTQSAIFNRLLPKQLLCCHRSSAWPVTNDDFASVCGPVDHQPGVVGIIPYEASGSPESYVSVPKLLIEQSEHDGRRHGSRRGGGFGGGGAGTHHLTAKWPAFVPNDLAYWLERDMLAAGFGAAIGMRLMR